MTRRRLETCWRKEGDSVGSIHRLYDLRCAFAVGEMYTLRGGRSEECWCSMQSFNLKGLG